MTEAREDSTKWVNYLPFGRGVGGTEKVKFFPWAGGEGVQDLWNFAVPNVIPKMFCNFYSAMHLFSSETEFFSS
jgi:hypothetical protein